jgi:hypothetical protein
MKMKRCLKRDNLPPSVPLTTGLVWWLALERFGAPSWLYGVLFTFLGLAAAVEVARVILCEEVDLLKED